MRNVQITKADNGFFVRLGSKTFIASNAQTLIEQLLFPDSLSLAQMQPGDTFTLSYEIEQRPAKPLTTEDLAKAVASYARNLLQGFPGGHEFTFEINLDRIKQSDSELTVKTDEELRRLAEGYRVKRTEPPTLYGMDPRNVEHDPYGFPK